MLEGHEGNSHPVIFLTASLQGVHHVFLVSRGKEDEHVVPKGYFSVMKLARDVEMEGSGQREYTEGGGG